MTNEQLQEIEYKARHGRELTFEEKSVLIALDTKMDEVKEERMMRKHERG